MRKISSLSAYYWTLLFSCFACAPLQASEAFSNSRSRNNFGIINTVRGGGSLSSSSSRGIVGSSNTPLTSLSSSPSSLHGSNDNVNEPVVIEEVSTVPIEGMKPGTFICSCNPFFDVVFTLHFYHHHHHYSFVQSKMSSVDRFIL